MSICRLPRLLGVLLAVALLGHGNSPAWSQEKLEPRVTLHAREMTAGEFAAALTTALGAEVRVEGNPARRATLDLDEAPAVSALDRVAAALDGRWQPLFRVAPGSMSVERKVAPGSLGRLGRSVTLRLRGTAVAPALAAVARAAGARLEASPNLTGTVFLEAQDLPVEDALDRLAAQVDLHWRMGYLLILDAVSPPSRPTTEESPSTSPPDPPVSLTPPPSGRSRVPLASRGGPTPAMLRQLLTVDLARLLQTPPRSRGTAVTRYATRLDHALRGLEPLPPLERTRRLTPLRGLFRSGLRAFGGLTPDQQRDFHPVEVLLRRWMP